MTDIDSSIWKKIYWTGIFTFNILVWYKPLQGIVNWLLSLNIPTLVNQAVSTAINLPLREKGIVISLIMIIIGGAGIVETMRKEEGEED